MNCPRCGESKIYHDPRFEAWYCSLCYFRWTWTPSGRSTMERQWLKPDGKGIDAPTLILRPKTPDDHDLCERILKTLDIRDQPDTCIACRGSGLSSHGKGCFPCHGTGKQGPHEIIGARIVYEMKSSCSCGSRHFVYNGTAKNPNVYTCDKCGKNYRSDKGVFVSLDSPPGKPLSNAEMAKAIGAKKSPSILPQKAVVVAKAKPAAPTPKRQSPQGSITSPSPKPRTPVIVLRKKK